MTHPASTSDFLAQLLLPILNLLPHLLRRRRAIALHGGNRSLDAQDVVNRFIQFRQGFAEIFQRQIG